MACITLPRETVSRKEVSFEYISPEGHGDRLMYSNVTSLRDTISRGKVMHNVNVQKL